MENRCRRNLKLNPNKSKQIQTKVSNNGPWNLKRNHIKHMQKFKTMVIEP